MGCADINSIDVAFYSPPSKGRQTGGFIYNANLLNCLQRFGYSTVLSHSLAFEPSATIRVIDSLFAVAYMSARETATNALFLYHLPPYAVGPVPQSWLRKERMLILTEKIVVTGTEALNILFARHDISRSQLAALVTVISPGINPKWRQKSQYSNLAYQLVVLGSIIPAKGTEEIIDALTQLQHLPWQCRFYGEVEQDPLFSADMMAKVRARHLSDKIEFVGPISHDDINKVMCDADLMLNFSHFETFSMVNAEAIAVGLPVLSRKVGEVTIFSQAKNVIFFNPDLKQDAVSRLASLLTNKAAYRTLCGNEKFNIKSWHQVANQWCEKLQSAACGEER